MPLYNPLSMKTFKEQMGSPYAYDDDLDENGKPGVRKARIRVLVGLIVLVCLGIVLARAWAALVLLACLVVPIGLYLRWVYTAPKAPPAPDK
jgi:hypothetical protein